MRKIIILSALLLASCSKEKTNYQPEPTSGTYKEYKITDFYVDKTTNGSNVTATVNWEAVGEDMITKYDLERKMDSDNSWVTIKSLASSGKNEHTTYQYIDKINGNTHDAHSAYRLKATRKINEVEYSSVVTIDLGY